MKKFITVNIVALCMFCWFTGCATSLSNGGMTGKVLPKGDFQFGMGLGVEVFTFDTELFDFFIPYPGIEFYGRYGLHNNGDLSFRFAFTGMSALYRYQLLGTEEDSEFALSLGLEGGYASLTVDDDTFRRFDGGAGVYLSLHPGRFFSIYGSPKYILSMYSGDDDENLHILGVTVGLRLGSIRNHFFIEGGYGGGFLSSDDVTTDIIQVMTGFNFGF